MRPLAALLILVALPAFGEERCKAAVLDLTPGAGIEADRAAALSEVLTTNVGEHLGCDVLGKSELRGMITFEAEKQAAGCTDDNCMAEIGDALGVRYLITGDIAEVDRSVLVSLRMMDLDETKVVARVAESYVGRGRGLIEFIGWASRKLVTKDPLVVGERPKSDPGHVVVERRATVWRQIAWGSVATASTLGVIAGGLGGGTLSINLSLPNLKTARRPDVPLIDSLEDTGPVLASSANLALYAAIASAAVAVGFFFLPGEEQVELSARVAP